MPRAVLGELCYILHVTPSVELGRSAIRAVAYDLAQTSKQDRFDSERQAQVWAFTGFT